MDVLKLYPVRRVIHTYMSDDDKINLAVVLGDIFILKDGLVSKFFGQKEALLQTSDSALADIPDDRLNTCLTTATCDEIFLERVFTRIDWNEITPYVRNRLTEQFIDRHGHHLRWDLLCYYQRLTNRLLETYGNSIFLDDLVRNQQLSDWFIEKYFQFLTNDAELVPGGPRPQHSSEIHMRWSAIHTLCRHQVLSEEFFEKHVQELMNMGIVLAHQKPNKGFFVKPNIQAVIQSEAFDQCSLIEFTLGSNKRVFGPTTRTTDWYFGRPRDTDFSVKPPFTVKDLKLAIRRSDSLLTANHHSP